MHSINMIWFNRSRGVRQGVGVLEYGWACGDGEVGFWLQRLASTTHSYAQTLSGIQATFTAFDSVNRETGCKHPLKLRDLSFIYGSTICERVGTAGPLAHSKRAPLRGLSWE
jgi:hypothetical protein